MLNDKILGNKYYQLFIKLLITAIVIVSYFALSMTLFKEFSAMNIMERILMIAIGLFASFSYLLILVIVWKKR